MLHVQGGVAEAVNANLQVGFHVEHVNSFNPIFRATRRYSDLATKADFLKVVVYNNCGGERYRRFLNNVQSTVFRDVPTELLLQFNNRLLGYGDEASLDELPQSGLSPDYIARETKRALTGVQGKCRIFPGIDIGIPTAADSRKALAYFEQCHKSIDLVITDLVMPGMTGDVLAAEMMKIKPEIPVIICTGHREMLNNTDTAKFRGFYSRNLPNP